ncbi:uncharacterized protein LOC108876943 [Lates calcarifer]|uniref:Uncharacterized protein LOC108876943 n=1 Tax=Lates calcarifer TaxID=8187 RepID=A0AAJ7LGT1_LATCA|nr:uncharacterized protein LOC108876943 [Lates calcarifer]
MNTITILLCTLAMPVISQTNEIVPVRILSQQKSISENSNLYVTCSTFGFKKNQQKVFVYLCKDGLGILKLVQKQDQHDTTFTMYNVGRNYSGNYSCAYSRAEYKPSEVATKGHNIIQILVIANFLPADISVAGQSTVNEGDNVEFRCTVSDTLQTLGKCQLIQSYLRRNEIVLQVQVFNVTRMETTFTIEDAVTRDTGHYSCVVLPSKCIQSHEKTLHGKNAVFLEVKVNLLLRVAVSCGVISLMLLLCVCLWWITKKQGHSGLHNQCTVSQQANTGMVEEELGQTEGQDLEAQDEESFSMGEEKGYQNGMAAEDSTYSDDYEE